MKPSIRTGIHKPKQCRLYLAKEDGERLEKLAKTIGQSESWTVSTLVGAVLRAAETAGNRLPLPMKVTIGPENS